MHFVIGGAFNGKAKWVKQYYKNVFQKLDWRSAYAPTFQADEFENVSTFSNGMVLEGIEYYVKEKLIDDENIERIRLTFNEQLNIWLHWEREQTGRTLIIIGNDLSKGVVPIEKKERLWRDVTGWCYQDITQMADTVDQIWYGIARRLK